MNKQPDDQTLGPADHASNAGDPISAPIRQEQPGQQIGRYKLLEPLGEGGFGAVWAAEQREPVKRRVALKIIKLGMDTKQVIARFEAERQALAMMDHPNIAKVLDAGATDTGRPFFAMELVKGVPIVEYCDREKLDTRARLDLFTKTCHAIQHAHQKGIIHRDIKPSNVLVTLHDGKPVPKVIDFGIAKATNQELTEKTIYTQHRQMIGTPAYMSPEQAEMSGLDIDTRSDIYSLGVLLYEMLTGTTPFSTEELNSAGFEGMMKLIREVEPHKPSTRLSSLDGTATRAAERRAADVQKLGLLLRGDLDWIVMKCLEKDRTRRYDTANALAEDIERHLNDEPVLASPPSTSYRLRKFVKRNRGQVVAGGMLAALLVMGIIGTSWGMAWALDEKQRADEQATIATAAAESERVAKLEAEENAQRAIDEAERAEAAEAEARSRADELAEVAEFQSSMLSSIDVSAAGMDLMRDIRERFSGGLEKEAASEQERISRVAAFGRDLELVNATDAAADLIDRTILKPAIDAVDARFADQPVVDASLRQTLSVVYTTLGRYDDAHALLREALDTRRRELGNDHGDTLLSLNNLGLLLNQQGRNAESEAHFREALERRRRVFGDEHDETLTVMLNLGSLLRSQGRFEEAEPLLLDALEGRRKTLGNEHRNTLIAVNNVGFLRINQGNIGEAEPYWREAYETGRRVLGADDPDVIVWTNNMGGIVGYLGREAEAEGYYREAYEANRRRYGETHPFTLTGLHNVGTSLSKQGRYDEAEAVYRETLAARRASLGEHHPDTLGSASGLGAVLQRQGRLDEAEVLARESLRLQRETLGDAHPSTFDGMSNLARLRMSQGDTAEAEALYREILERSEGVWGQEHPGRLIVMNNLGSVLLQEGRYDEAEPFILDVVALRRRVSGDSHAETAIALVNLARLYENQERFAEAEAAIAEAYATLRTVLGPRHPNALWAGTLMGSLLGKMDRHDEAVPLLRESLEGFEAALGPEHARTMHTRYGLGRVLAEIDEFEQAEPLLIEAARVYALGQIPNSARDHRRTVEILIPMYDRWHAADPGAGHDAKAAEWRAKLEATSGPATGS